MLGPLSASGSTFLNNESIGGVGGNARAGGTGGGGGLAEGAAIVVQSFPLAFPPQPPFPISTIASSLFVGNESKGGAGGSGGQGGVGGAGGQSYGGDVVSYGQVSITSSVFRFGVAKGGAGGAGVTEGAGGSAQGGSWT